MFNVDRLENLVKNGLNKNLLTKFLSIEKQKYLQSIKYLKFIFQILIQKKNENEHILPVKILMNQ